MKGVHSVTLKEGVVRWVAKIWFAGKYQGLGTFATSIEAADRFNEINEILRKDGEIVAAAAVAARKAARKAAKNNPDGRWFSRKKRTASDHKGVGSTTTGVMLLWFG